jgi:hypothetical protein
VGSLDQGVEGAVHGTRRDLRKGILIVRKCLREDGLRLTAFATSPKRVGLGYYRLDAKQQTSGQNTTITQQRISKYTSPSDEVPLWLEYIAIMLDSPWTVRLSLGAVDRAQYDRG